jgi:hypothetical protein
MKAEDRSAQNKCELKGLAYGMYNVPSFQHAFVVHTDKEQVMTTFWSWQQRALNWLLGWGIGSTIVGAGLATAKTPVVRHVGLQAVSWGAIDAALALSGRINARRKEQQLLDKAEEQHEASHFRKIVAVNAGLDVLYVLGGWWLMRRSERDAARRGMGLGIIVQGAFLLIYDSLLVWTMGRYQR